LMPQLNRGEIMLVRLGKQLDDKALANIKHASGGIGLQDLRAGWCWRWTN
jgi:hypothetical protein